MGLLEGPAVHGSRQAAFEEAKVMACCRLCTYLHLLDVGPRTCVGALDLRDGSEAAAAGAGGMGHCCRCCWCLPCGRRICSSGDLGMLHACDDAVLCSDLADVAPAG